MGISRGFTPQVRTFASESELRPQAESSASRRTAAATLDRSPRLLKRSQARDEDGVLAGAPVGHCVGQHALAHPDLRVVAREVLRHVHAHEPVLAWADESLTELATKLRTEDLDAAEMDGFLRRAMPGASSETLRHMREATASKWLRSMRWFLLLVMLADGGTNYHEGLAVLRLWWIHMLCPSACSRTARTARASSRRGGSCTAGSRPSERLPNPPKHPRSLPTSTACSTPTDAVTPTCADRC
jgi:hypothetical protein